MSAVEKRERTAKRTRNSSIIFRTNKAERALIQKAADAEKLDTSVYARRSLVKQAEMDLADRKDFTISEENMDAFLAALDQPVQNKPRLRKLLTEDSILD